MDIEPGGQQGADLDGLGVGLKPQGLGGRAEGPGVRVQARGAAVDPGGEPPGVLGVVRLRGPVQGVRHLIEEPFRLRVRLALQGGVEGAPLHTLGARHTLGPLGKDQIPGECALLRLARRGKGQAQALDLRRVAGKEGKVPGHEGGMPPGGALAAGVRQLRGQAVAQVAQQVRVDADAGAEQGKEQACPRILPHRRLQVHRCGGPGPGAGGPGRDLGAAVEEDREVETGQGRVPPAGGAGGQGDRPSRTQA